jgi:hypothetical protein
MKLTRKSKGLRAKPLSSRRPASFRAMNDLIARRQRLRKRIGAAVAMGLSLGLLVLGLE